MFLGEYEYKVDSKGRVPLPPKFRQEFGDVVILTRGTEQCIAAYRKSDFEKISDAIAPERIIENEKLRKLKRATFANAKDVLLDGQGRIALPSRLKDYAQIKDVAILVGLNNSIELWNPELWNAERIEAEGQVHQIIESLESEQ